MQHLCRRFHDTENVHVFIPGVSIRFIRNFCVQEVLMHICLPSLHPNALFGFIGTELTSKGVSPRMSENTMSAISPKNYWILLFVLQIIGQESSAVFVVMAIDTEVLPI